MRLTLRLSPSLLKTIDEKLQIELPGETLDDCLSYGARMYPELKQIIWSDAQQLNTQVLFFHNDTQIKQHDLKNSVKKNDVLDLIPAIEGG